MGSFLHSVPVHNTDLSDNQDCTKWPGWQAKNKSDFAKAFMAYIFLGYFYQYIRRKWDFSQEQGDKPSRPETAAASLPNQVLLWFRDPPGWSHCSHARETQTPVREVWGLGCSTAHEAVKMPSVPGRFGEPSVKQKTPLHHHHCLAAWCPAFPVPSLLLLIPPTNQLILHK